MTATEYKELVIVGMLLAAALGLHAMGNIEGSAMLIGAACALVVPRAGTPTRLAVLGGVIGLAMASQGCATAPSKPEIRSAVRLACEAADFALSGEPDPMCEPGSSSTTPGDMSHTSGGVSELVTPGNKSAGDPIRTR